MDRCYKEQLHRECSGYQATCGKILQLATNEEHVTSNHEMASLETIKISDYCSNKTDHLRDVYSGR